MRTGARTMRKVTLLLAAMALAVVLAALPAQAATTTLVVDREGDSATATACTSADDDCSLRGAIIAASTMEGADVILVVTMAMSMLYLLAGCVGSDRQQQALVRVETSNLRRTRS